MENDFYHRSVPLNRNNNNILLLLLSIAESQLMFSQVAHLWPTDQSSFRVDNITDVQCS